MENEKTEETPKLSKTEEKESFLKRLEAKTNELRETEQRIQALVERNEELASRNLLGGQTDSVTEPDTVKEESPQDYAKKVMSGEIKFTK